MVKDIERVRSHLIGSEIKTPQSCIDTLCLIPGDQGCSRGRHVCVASRVHTAERQRFQLLSHHSYLGPLDHPSIVLGVIFAERVDCQWECILAV